MSNQEQFGCVVTVCRKFRQKEKNENSQRNDCCQL